MDEVAEDAGVSKRTVRRATAYAKAVEKLTPEIQRRVTGGKLKVSQKDVIELAAYTHDEQVAIVAEFDAGEFKTLGGAMRGETQDGDASQQRSIPLPPVGDGSGSDASLPNLPSRDTVSLDGIKRRRGKLGKNATEAELFLECQKALGYFNHAVEEWKRGGGSQLVYANAMPKIKELANLFTRPASQAGVA